MDKGKRWEKRKTEEKRKERYQNSGRKDGERR